MSASNEIISNYVESRITRLEVSQENIMQSLARIEKSMADGFSAMNGRFLGLENEVDNRFDRLEDRITRIENRLWQMMFLFPGVVVGLIITHALHWT